MANIEEIQTIRKLQDPFYFIPHILGVPYLTKDQNKIVERVWMDKYVDVPSAHGIGKTFIAATIVLSYLIPYPDTIVVSTAPTGRQVRDLLWSEIHNLYNRATYRLGGKLTQLRLDIGPKWFATGISVKLGQEERSAVQFQGYHAGRVLVVVDEACGVKPAIWEAIDGVTSNEQARILSIGNPSQINVPFHKNVKNKKRTSIEICALFHPNVVSKTEVIPGAVSYTWVKEKIESWCTEVSSHDPEMNTFEFEDVIYMPNNLFRWKVLGKFPTDNEEGLISYSSIQAAMNADIKPLGFNNMAVDVARLRDMTVFTFDSGNVFEQVSFHGLDVVEVADKTIEYIKIIQPDKVGIDADGIGSGVYDIIKRKRRDGEIKIKVYDEEKDVEIVKEVDFMLIAIHSGKKALEKVKGKKITARFLNIRCQMYWQLRLDMPHIQIPLDETLEEELLTVDYETPNGIIAVTKKEEIKGIINRSPDKMDSLVYCNWMKYVREKKLRAMVRI